MLRRSFSSAEPTKRIFAPGTAFMGAPQQNSVAFQIAPTENLLAKRVPWPKQLMTLIVLPKAEVSFRVKYR